MLATGAIERPLVFADNDRPGIMLASAAQSYVNRYGLAPGKRAVVFTNNDGAYEAALDLLDAGIEVAAIVDPRSKPGGELAALARKRGIEVLASAAITALFCGFFSWRLPTVTVYGPRSTVTSTVTAG